MEIQRPLSGGPSFSFNEPLQAVQEMEDDDDCIDKEDENMINKKSYEALTKIWIHINRAL